MADAARSRRSAAAARVARVNAHRPAVVFAPSGEDRTALAVAWLSRLIARRRAGTLTDR